MVQRFGRCNRRGTIPDAEVLWIDIQPKDDTDDLCLPYSAAELSLARAQLSKIVDARPNFLASIAVAEAPVIRPVLRRRDLLDLFDTTPDLCGQDLDVSRYIRDGEDKDVQFYWRDLSEDRPSIDEPPPDRDELCRVSLGDAEKFLTKNKKAAWQWNPVEKRWVSVTKPRPGSLYLLAAEAGGYQEALGWTGDPKQKPSPLTNRPTGESDANDADPESFVGSWQSVAQHTAHVVRTTTLLSEALVLSAAERASLRSAALWHDVGKAHNAFQTMIRGEAPPESSQIWAKSPHRSRMDGRKGFRHELASALAWLIAAPANTDDRDLIAYLIAAHHGKVRLSIRSLPSEETPEGAEDRLFARGVVDGDMLPSVSLGEIVTPPVALDLSFMRLGTGPLGPSWLARSIALRDRIGPFGLAFLESVLRAADAQASQSEG
jgi:CRISPR-associated endonuclease/helicase Cas3